MKITEVKGIGEKTEKLFQKVGVFTTEQLLEFYPRNYDRYEQPVEPSELENQKIAAFYCVIIASPVVRQVRKMSILVVEARTREGEKVLLKWYNMPFLRGRFKIGMHFIFRGRIKKNQFSFQQMQETIMEQPEIFTEEEYQKKLGGLTPIYSLTEGLSNKLVTKSVRQVLEKSGCYEFLPEKILEDADLLSYQDAIWKIHFPTDYEEMERARKRLAFQEFLLFLLALQKFKAEEEIVPNGYPVAAAAETDAFIEKLPYHLTNAQKKVVGEIRRDFQGKRVMNRLVQGDVGSGKTIVALIGLLDVAFAGYQGALMAPTEVLAVQHYESICEMFEKYDIPIRVELLTGSMTAKEKRQAYERISLGISKIIIGTHALIQERVQYKNLAFVITDEQHRFGVKQRETFSEKGEQPHILVMSATPIPRTLAIILYGDLDVSVIDELPQGRLPIKNCVVGQEYRPNAYKFIQGEVEKGHQCYVICPMIEESENLEAVDVVGYTEILRENLPGTIRVEYLHGKMKAGLKNELMEAFSKNEIQVLVSTTVIEVGVNVPNATVMLVENAERFGLASLHQLRGRVGRGDAQSYCIFISTSSKKETRERLDILNRSNDGFEIANWDLKLRGPGAFFGIRQSGDMDFKIGDIFSDAQTLKQASEASKYIMEHWTEIGPGTMQMLENKLQTYMEDKFRLNL